MTKHKTHSELAGTSKREQLRQQQAQAAQAAKLKRTITFSVIGVALLTLIAVIVVVVFNNNSKSNDPTSTLGADQIKPPNASADDYSIVVDPGKALSDAIILDIHTDYQCPYCAAYEGYFGQTFRELAERGDIELRIHPRTVIGDWLIGNDSSLRASTAVACADVVGKFYDLHSTIFANQPEKEGVGYTDEQLRSTFPRSAGITGENLATYQQCYDNRLTEGWVRASENEGYNHALPDAEDTRYHVGIRATPTFLVNGKLVSLSQTTDFSTDGVLQLLKAAA
ncbi:MAG: DsbA family protein [Propionibacteriaceae bacterium]|jgi:protein-disulfide isomerase|nr:DsbA family protein [Propionibacteriaceae bacterium]